MKKREIVLSSEQVKALVAKAKEHSLRDYLLFRLYSTKGFRAGEIVGSEARHRDRETKKWVPQDPTLPGLRIQDLRDDGVWVQGKGWQKKDDPNPPELVRLSAELVQQLRTYIGKRKAGRIFELSVRRVEQLCHQYAKEAGIPDWNLVHPHRLRHFGGTQVYEMEGKDLRAAKSFLRHKSMASTYRYISDRTPEEQAKTSGKMEALVST